MKKMSLAFIAALSTLLVFGQVRIETKSPEQKLNEEYCTGLFKSTDGVILDLENSASIGAYFNILDWLDGRVAGLSVNKTRSGNRVPIILNLVAGIFVDEMPVSASYLNALPSVEIAMIKVIRTPFFGNPYGSGGAIAIYTYGMETGDEETGARENDREFPARF